MVLGISRLLCALAVLGAGISTSCIPMPDAHGGRMAPFFLASPFHIHTYVPGFASTRYAIAYGFPCYPGGPIVTAQHPCIVPGDAPTPTVAIVDAFHDPTITADLAVYDQTVGLPACSTDNGCLTVAPGDPTQQPFTDPACGSPDGCWSDEVSLDVEAVHTICQSCRILLVEATSAATEDLTQAETTAVSLGARIVSNSWGGMETGERDAAYAVRGVAIVVASGDSGADPSYPADLPSVISVGGTTLITGNDSRYLSEEVWYWANKQVGTGSGCSFDQAAPSWQMALPGYRKSGCAGARLDNDLAIVGDPASGQATYSQGHWGVYGGTSLSAPIIAAAIALAGGPPPNSNGAHFLYRHPHQFHDIKLGANGTCLWVRQCQSHRGFDGPTGLGTPRGLGAL